MEIQPILAALRRHKLTTVLLALQVALTCTVVSNAVFMIVQRVKLVTTPSGVDERALSLVTADDLQVGPNPLSLHQTDVAALRRLPGVKSAAIVDYVPFSGVQNSLGICGGLDAMHAAATSGSPLTEVRGCAEPAQYDGGPGVLQALGLKLVAGRDFRATEYIPGKRNYSFGAVPGAIISEALAARLFPSHPHQAVGRSLYFGSMGYAHITGIPIVGVVQRLQRGVFMRGSSDGLSMLLPIEPNHDSATFALRSKPADRTRVMREALAKLNALRPMRQLSASAAETYTQVRARYFGRDTTMIGMLVAATLGLLFVTAIGVAGLANFWVQQRTHTIGIRRAVGATRSDILRYFQTENFLIVSFGVVPGLIMAIGVNLLLMKYFEMPHLPLWYLLIGAVTLWLLGQIAVLVPALRAAAVSPAVATRNL